MVLLTFLKHEWGMELRGATGGTSKSHSEVSLSYSKEVVLRKREIIPHKKPISQLMDIILLE